MKGHYDLLGSTEAHIASSRCACNRMNMRALTLHGFTHTMQISSAVHAESNQDLVLGAAPVRQPRDREGQQIAVVAIRYRN